MTPHRANGNSLRLERLDGSRLFWALALSLVVHLLCWGGYSLNKKYHLLDKLGLPALIAKLTPAVLKKPAPESPPPQVEVPLVFVNVNPDTATPEPPKDAKFYSNLNAKAANPDPEQDTEQPKLTGEQTVVTETQDIPKNKFDRLQPTPRAEEPQEEEAAKPKQAVGDLAMAKPDLNPNAKPGTAERERPRRLSQVQPNPAQRPPSRMMKQDGGVRNRLESPSLDTKSTITGDYDARFIDAVKDRWFRLLEDRDYTAQGYVQLRFRLHHDGRISEMKVLKNTVTEIQSIVCQKAVQDPAPFDRWNPEMRKLIGRDFREITFTFHYY
jgi:hypothetical protein